MRASPWGSSLSQAVCANARPPPPHPHPHPHPLFPGISADDFTMGPLAEWRKEREEKLAVKAVRAHCTWRMAHAVTWMGRGGGGARQPCLAVTLTLAPTP